MPWGEQKESLVWVASVWFSVAAEHKEICTESLTNLMQVFTLDYISLDNPLFGCESQGPQMCVLHCGARLQIFTCIHGCETMKAQKVQWLTQHRRRGKLTCIEWALCTDWLTMSQEEPHIELRVESFLQCHQHVCHNLSRIRISNNVAHKRSTCSARDNHSLLSLFVVPSHSMSLSYLAVSTFSGIGHVKMIVCFVYW